MSKWLKNIVLVVALAASAGATNYTSSRGLLFDGSTGALIVTSSPVLPVIVNSYGFTVDSTGALVISISGGGGGTWGSITGTLSSQTDLQTALDAKASLSGSQSLSNKTLNGANSGNSVTLLNSQYGTATLTGNSSAQVIFTYTLPANTLAAGKGIRIHARMLQSGSTSTTYSINFGGTAAVSYATTVAANNILVADIFNQPGLTNAQVALPLFAGSTGGIVALSALNDPAVDTTANQTITLTFNVANTVTITKYAWAVELIQ